MAIDPWEVLRVAVRVAHMQRVSPVRGAAVELDGSLASLSNPPSKEMITIYAKRSAAPGGGHNIYTLSDANTPGALAAQVFWLPYNENTNQLVDIRGLNKNGATMFLTSGLSGCHFVGCDGAVVHSPAQKHPKSAQEQIARVLRDPPSKNFFLVSAQNRNEAGSLNGRTTFYGDGLGPPRAVVMGWKSPSDQWFFAYQELTINVDNYGFWHALGG